MKRGGPLRRKKGLNPGKPPQRNTPLVRKTRMKPVSDKRRRLMRETKPFRDRYLAKHMVCEVCLRRKPREVHEITRGPHREKALDKEVAVLAVCRECHEEIGGWKVSKQLALKVLRSPKLFGFTFAAINELRGYSATEFEPEDVFLHLEVK